jgi:hypothetical protein
VIAVMHRRRVNQFPKLGQRSSFRDCSNLISFVLKKSTSFAIWRHTGIYGVVSRLWPSGTSVRTQVQTGMVEP